MQTLSGHRLCGTVAAIDSKSQVHRLLICAALSDAPSELRCVTRSEDILATAACLRALGAEIEDTGAGFRVQPLRRDAVPLGAELPCGESGSTLRFLLPVVCALGTPVQLHMRGRLPQRPLSPLYELLAEHGCWLGRAGSNPLSAAGPLRGSEFTIAADVSSQFISGLLFALPLLGGGSIRLTGEIESAAYLTLTEDALRLAGVTVERRYDSSRQLVGYTVSGEYHLPPVVQAEGDWSNAALWLCAGAIGGGAIRVTRLDLSSHQGDRAVLSLLKRFGAQVETGADWAQTAPAPLRGIRIDAAQIPDLVPALAVVAAAAEGETLIYNAGRLRLKESDRLETTAALLRALGVEVDERPTALAIQGAARITGGTVDAAGDHRIAMAAALASCLSAWPLALHGGDCVKKSYPQFFEDFAALGGVIGG